MSKKSKKRIQKMKKDKLKKVIAPCVVVAIILIITFMVHTQ